MRTKSAGTTTIDTVTTDEPACRMKVEKLNSIQLQIVNEICKAMGDLGAEPGLLATVCSWGDTLPEAEVLSQLKQWNATGNQLPRRHNQRRFDA